MIENERATQKETPRNIHYGIRLLSLALAISVLRAIIGIPMLKEPVLMQIVMLVSALFIVFGALLILMIYKGKEWARITQLVLFAVGITQNIESMVLWAYTAPLLLYLYLIEIFLTIIALVFIFHSQSAVWFIEN